MAQILKGAPVVAAMNEANAARCAALKEKGIVPTLAVVRVGAREDDISYEKGIVTRCGKVGVEVRQFHLAEDVTQEELLDVIRQINGDASVHGCLIFRPLPKRFDDRRVQEALAPEKDVDGITDGSMAGVFTNMPIGYPPCTAQACLEILKYYNVLLSGKRAVVVGRSLVVGKPAAMMLDRENATVTLCNSRTRDLPPSAVRPMCWWSPWAGGVPLGPIACGKVRSWWMWASTSMKRASSAAMSALMRQNPSWRLSPRCPAVWAQ